MINKKHFLIGLSLLLFSSLLSLLIAELIAGYWMRGKVFGVPNPGKENPRYQELYRLNSKGLRDFEYGYEKPPGVFRILGLGDSFTFGQEVPREKTFLKKLEKRLNESGGIKYEVINMGMRGHNTVQELELFQKEGIKYHPDLVLLNFVINDPEVTDYQRRYRRVRLIPWPALDSHLTMKSNLYFLAKKRLNNFLARHHLIDNYNEYCFKLFSPDTNKYWPDFVNALQRFSELSREHNVPVIFVFLTNVASVRNGEYRYRSAHETVMQVVESLFPVIELYPRFLELNMNSDELSISPHDGHPNSFSHTIFSDGIYEALLTMRLLPGIKPEGPQ